MKWVYGLLPLLILLVFSIVACVLGYAVVQIADGWSLNKVISKITLIFLVLAIFPAMAYLKIDRHSLGFTGKWRFIKRSGQGFLLGIATLFPVLLVLYALDVSVIDQSKSWTAAVIIPKLLVALLLSMLIALLEEPLFRGVLLAGLRKQFSCITAIILSAVYYAALHFINTKTVIKSADLQFSDAFRLLLEAFANVFNPVNFSALLALLVVGIFLGLLRSQYKDGLALCIGCHSAWVWQIKMGKELFNSNANSEFIYLVNPYNEVIGPLVSVWLLLSMLLYWLFRQHQAKKTTVK